MLDAAVDAVILITHQGIVEAFNTSAVRLFGYTTDEIIGRNVRLLMTDQDAESHDAHLERYVRTGQSRVLGIGREVVARRKDGSQFPAFLSIGRISGSNPPRFVGFLQDITLRKQAMAAIEEERERSNQTRERMLHVARMATMGEMASGISHEVNQPLAAIANFAQAASRMLRQSDSDLGDVRNALDQIAAQALRAGKIIHHLRKLVGTRDSHREPTDINELVRETDSLTRADAREHDVQVRLELTPGLPQLLIDRIQIQQVMLNLLRNAIDALAHAGIASREVSIRSALTPDGDVTVMVGDNGTGVAKEMLPKLFMPFTTNKTHGTGLGLAMSRTIVEAHRGRLEYQSNVPCGSLFMLTLPH